MLADALPSAFEQSVWAPLPFKNSSIKLLGYELVPTQVVVKRLVRLSRKPIHLAEQPRPEKSALEQSVKGVLYAFVQASLKPLMGWKIDRVSAELAWANITRGNGSSSRAVANDAVVERRMAVRSMNSEGCQMGCAQSCPVHPELPFEIKADSTIAQCSDRSWRYDSGEILVARSSQLFICQSESKRTASNNTKSSEPLLSECYS